MRLNKRLAFLIVGVWQVAAAMAQPTAYRSFHNVIAGAGATTVSAFAQDSLGMVWLGTNMGLVSYDGYVTQAHHRHNDSTNTYVYTIAVLNSRVMCLGTDNGVLFYDYQNDTYLTNAISFPSDVRTLLLDGNNLWIGSLKRSEERRVGKECRQRRAR